MPLNYSITSIDDRNMAVLKVESVLDFEVRSDFQQAMTELFAADAGKLVIDLSRITRMFSLFIGTLIDHGNAARAAGRSLTVILPVQMAKTCREAGLDKAVTIVTRGKTDRKK